MQVDDQQYIAKPMNCPFNCTMFKKGLRSYRELPHPLGRARHGVSLRALGRDARPAPRPRL